MADEFDYESFYNTYGGDSYDSTPSSFDASDLSNLYSNVDTNSLSDFFSKIGSSVSNLFSDTDLSKYFDTATPGAESYFTKDISPDLGISGNRVYYDDGSFSVVDPETGTILGGVDTENKGFTVDENGKATYIDSGEGLGGTPEKTFGGNLADKADVDALLKYNAAIAQGGYAVQNQDKSVTVKDVNGKD